MRKIGYLLILITTLLISLLLPVLGKTHAIDFGNVSDVLSALSNVGVLSLTLFIVIKAKDFLKAKIQDEGFNRGALLLDEIDILYDSSIPYFDTVNIEVRDYNMAFGNENYLNLSGESVLNSINYNMIELTKLRSKIDALRVTKQRLKRWSISITHEMDIDKFIISLDHYLLALISILEHYQEPYNDYLLYHGTATSLENYNDAKANMLDIKEELMNNYNILLGYKLHQMFEIK